MFGLSLCILCFLPLSMSPFHLNCARVSHKPVLFLYSLILPWARILICFTLWIQDFIFISFHVVQKESSTLIQAEASGFLQVCG